ncbi:MAG: hypothetical protein ACLUV3_06400 [Oscillospiraceae bacterium]
MYIEAAILDLLKVIILITIFFIGLIILYSSLQKTKLLDGLLNLHHEINNKIQTPKQ